MDMKLTKKDAIAIITLCVDEGLKQGIVKASEYEELLDILDEAFTFRPEITEL